MAEDPTIHAMTVCSSMIHRSGWERFGQFKLDLMQLNDWELCARIGVHTGVLNVEDAVAYYRVHGSSLGDALVVAAPLRHGRAVPAGASLRCRLSAGHTRRCGRRHGRRISTFDTSCSTQRVTPGTASAHYSEHARRRARRRRVERHAEALPRPPLGAGRLLSAEDLAVAAPAAQAGPRQRHACPPARGRSRVSPPTRTEVPVRLHRHHLPERREVPGGGGRERPWRRPS